MPTATTALSVFAAFWIGLSAVGAEPPKSGFGTGAVDFHREYFTRRLAKCPEAEVRCIWFDERGLAVGHYMTFDLSAQTIVDGSDSPSWARMGSSPRRLTHHQVTVIRRVTNSLTPDGSAVKLEDGLNIAFQKDGKLVIFTFDRSKVPLAVQRLFDVGGVEAKLKYEEPKPGK
jgi:hypothetical protein